MTMHLFQHGQFPLHSGNVSPFKIECDALTYQDWETLALIIRTIYPAYCAVESVPRGGDILASLLKPYAIKNTEDLPCLESTIPLLIVDDVLTTGNSMEAQRAGRSAAGVCVFSRLPYFQIPSWIRPLFVTCF